MRNGEMEEYMKEKEVDKKETFPLQKQRDIQNQTRKQKGSRSPLAIR